MKKLLLSLLAATTLSCHADAAVQRSYLVVVLQQPTPSVISLSNRKLFTFSVGVNYIPAGSGIIYINFFPSDPSVIYIDSGCTIQYANKQIVNNYCVNQIGSIANQGVTNISFTAQDVISSYPPVATKYMNATSADLTVTQ